MQNIGQVQALPIVRRRDSEHNRDYETPNGIYRLMFLNGIPFKKFEISGVIYFDKASYYPEIF